LKDPGLVTHRLAHPDLTEAGGTREEDDKQYPSRDGAFRMEETSGTQEEDERFLTRDGAISLEMAGRAREMDARFSSREGANTNWRRDGLKDPGPLTLQLELPDLMEAGGAPEEDEWLLSREGTCKKEVVSGAPEEDKQLSSRERVSTTRWRAGLNNPGRVTHRLEHHHILETGGAREENEKQPPSRDGAFMMKGASGAQQDDKQLSSRTEEGCKARVEDKLFSAREDANTRYGGYKNLGFTEPRVQIDWGQAEPERRTPTRSLPKKRHVEPARRLGSTPRLKWETEQGRTPRTPQQRNPAPLQQSDHAPAPPLLGAPGETPAQSHVLHSSGPG